MAVTVLKNLAQSASEQRTRMTIEELANGDGLTYRHPDSAQVSYPLTVQRPLGTVPGGQTSAAIIGAGPAGIAALYELRQIADSNRGHQFQVRLFELDPSNFLFKSRPQNPPQVMPYRAGRVSSYYAPNTVYEIGAMRFPSIAGLIWHYADRVFGAKERVDPFPNPGTVPTEFVFGSRFDRYFGGTWMSSNSPTMIVRDLILEGLVGTPANPPPANPPLYMIGSRTAAQVTAELKRPHPPQPPNPVLVQIQSDWGDFIEHHDGTTLEAAVRAILIRAQRNNRLPPVAGLTGNQLLNWCVELFGRFGFGTGGFKSLYNMSLVEMMRLMLWDYSNEYTFPPNLASGNVDFIAGLHRRATTRSENFIVESTLARVSDVFHQDDPRAVGVAYYYDTDVIQFAYFDYAILAMPHDATTAVVSRLGYSPQPLDNPEIGDFGRAARPGRAVLPALLLSTHNDTVNARIATAVSMLHMTRSSKVLATIAAGDATSDPVPEFPPDNRISAVISDCGLAASYMVPSPTDPHKYASFLVTYTWDDDSTKLQNTFAQWPEHFPPPGPDAMFDAMLNRAYRQDPEDPTNTASKWWLYTVLRKVLPADRVSWDWSTYITAGGFKLDMTGDHNQSNLCFRYHTHAYNHPSLPPEERIDSRVFLASCSYSHLGGWLEGAFMSAINAVAGIVVSLNNGDIRNLNLEAQNLFTTLTPVIPMT